MAFIPNKPLLFDLPDGTCHVMTYEYFLDLMTQILTPIEASINLNIDSLGRINAQVDEWLAEQAENNS